MAEVFTPITTTNLTNQTSITQAIDQNFTTIAKMLDDVLSRGGTSPNAMASSLDMNSNQIINLPVPGTANSPARLQDVISPTSLNVSIISGNNMFTGTNSFGATTNLVTTNIDGALNVTGNMAITGDVFFGNGYPWADVRAFGAVGNGIVNDSSSIQAAVNAVSALGGGTVYVPPGNYYISATTINLPQYCWIIGNYLNSVITSGTADCNVISMNGYYCGLEKLFLQGNVSNTSSTGSTILVSGSCIGGVVRDVLAWGGANGIFTQGTDCVFDNVFPAGFFACVQSQGGGNWYMRVKMDTGPLSSQSYGFWHGSISGFAAPENHLIACDFSNESFTWYAVEISDGTSTAESITCFDSCVVSSLNLIKGKATLFSNCEFAPSNTISNPASSQAAVVGCYCPSASSSYAVTGFQYVGNVYA